MDITVFVETIGNIKVVQKCFHTLLETCPFNYPIFIFDSKISETDGTRDFLIKNKDSRTTLYLSDTNHDRWSAMHQMIPYVTTNYILCVSSDVLFNGQDWHKNIEQTIISNTKQKIAVIANLQAGNYKHKSGCQNFFDKQIMLTFNFWGVFIVFNILFLRQYLNYFRPFWSETKLPLVTDIMSEDEQNRMTKSAIMTDSMATMAHILFTTNVAKYYCHKWLPVAFKDDLYNHRILKTIDRPLVGEHLPTPISYYAYSKPIRNQLIFGDNPNITIIK